MTRTTRTSLSALFALTLAACGGSPQQSARIGPSGGTLSTASGARLVVPAGALERETEIRLVEARPRDGVARVEMEPHGLRLAARARISVPMPAGQGPMKLVGIENEVEHGLEAERENEREHAREAEVEHLGEVELRHQAICLPACGAAEECDDGACKPHVEDPSAPPASGNCPAGQELDVSDNVCKPHGGGGATGGVPPVSGTCPDGTELDPSDGTCKPHGGGGTSGGGADDPAGHP